MSKHEKDFVDSGSLGAPASEATAGSADLLQSAPATGNRMGAIQVKSEIQAKSEQSRQFNAWLDRMLPILQQTLGDSTTGAVTSPGSKPKH